MHVEVMKSLPRWLPAAPDVVFFGFWVLVDSSPMKSLFVFFCIV